MKRAVSLPIAAVLAAVGLTACGSSEGRPAVDARIPRKPAAPASTASVRLAWNHTAKNGSDPEVWYVARVRNDSKSAAAVVIDAQALDKSGTIVGSAETSLPRVPAGATFDYFGDLGGGLSAALTGVPAKVQVTLNKTAGQAGISELGALATSDQTLTRDSSGDQYTGAPYAYDLAVKATNGTRAAVSGGVTQQVVLYDAKGSIVGGGTGASDNAPDTLPAGASYREKWTGIPAVAKAVRAVYTVWPG
ncbi:hypothetical protein [Streptomyces sp. NPDC051452]|uniref:hypothetical protein n=1 Tax=Streptomyces sp. NPDC051452 TaxID=3365654 RepID=UPI0037A5183A